MRNIVNISLPREMNATIEKEMKAGGFATKSEFFRHLVRLWNSRELAAGLHERRREFRAGQGKKLRSLRDLAGRDSCPATIEAGRKKRGKAYSV